MNKESAILIEEKMSALLGNIRQLQDEKFKLHSEIDILSKEKEILLNALNRYVEIEETNAELKDKNIQLESQLNALMKSIENIEKQFGN